MLIYSKFTRNPVTTNINWFMTFNSKNMIEKESVVNKNTSNVRTQRKRAQVSQRMQPQLSNPETSWRLSTGVLRLDFWDRLGGSISNCKWSTTSFPFFFFFTLNNNFYCDLVKQNSTNIKGHH